MDVEDEANSYLKYLTDSDAPNTYLLGNNEVGLFSVEPIFTEMEASDWPQEGFPLLLTNSLMGAEDQESSSQDSEKINEFEYQNKTHTSLEGVTENSEDNRIIENQITLQDKIHLDENTLHFGDNLVPDQEHIYLNENCVQITISGNQDNYTIQPVKNDNQPSNIEVIVNENGINKISEDPYKKQVKPKKKFLLVNQHNLRSSSKTVQLKNSKEAQVSLIDPSIKSKNIVLAKKKTLVSQKRDPKNINDLFSTVIANKCNICGFLCEDLEQIKKHIGEKHPECLFTHNGLTNGVSVLLSNIKKKKEENSGVDKEYTIFVCSECHSVCTDENTLKQHMIEEHQSSKEENIKESSTDIDDPEPTLKRVSVLSDINIGLVKRQEKALQRIKCTVSGCPAGFPTLELCKAHAKLHIGNTRTHFSCQKCDKTFMMWRIARSHMQKEHGIDFGMIVCPVCNAFKSYREATILRHMMIHSEQKPFICDECGKAYKQLSQLKNHEALHKLPEDMPTWARVKKCDKCHQFFANSKCLKKHIQSVHEKFKPFICNICGHQTTRKAMLELHLRQHTGQKPFKCEECEYTTRDHNCLRRHVMKHFGAVRYQCPYCPFGCIQASSIKLHLLHKHKGRGGTFSCKYCSYSTINQSHLYSHEKMHEITAAAKGANTETTNTTARERRETDPQTDEETQSYFLNTESQIEETVDNGGITIPAELEIPLVT